MPYTPKTPAVYFCTDGAYVYDGTQEPYRFSTDVEDLVSVLISQSAIDLQGVTFRVLDRPFAEDKPDTTEDTMTDKVTTIDIGSVSNAKELIFGRGDVPTDDTAYRVRFILQPKDTTENHLSTITRYPNHDITRTVHHYIDDTDGTWFACYNVDCFDPPFAIIRARSFETAYEVFLDEFSDWLTVEAPDSADYPEDDREYNGSGVHIDTSNVQIVPLSLISILL